MNEKIWTLLEWRWPNGVGPGAYSWFHIIWLIICVAASFCLIYFLARRHDYKIDLLICRIAAITLIGIESLKLITYSIDRGHFPCDSIPFQICSIPYYIYAISSFFSKPKSKIRVHLLKFSAYLGLIGGLGVMIYPAATLNTPYIYFSIHTMIWHTVLVSVSLYYFISLDVGKSLKEDLMFSSIGFISVTGIAILINELGYIYYYLPIGKLRKEEINCFWIARHFKTQYPVLDKIKENTHYAVFLISFLIIIILVMFIFHYLFRIIKYHSLKSQNRHKI